tara:strand:- start:8 stop:133 length:126 start_codon:yes stop_codon:yes gene_type:complete
MRTCPVVLAGRLISSADASEARQWRRSAARSSILTIKSAFG